MKHQLSAALERPIVRYIIIGGSVYLFELAVIVTAQHQGASPVVAVGLSFWLGCIVSFILTKVITFRDRRTHHRVVIPQLVAVTLLVLFNFVFTVLLTKLLEDVLPPVVTRTLALGTTTIWNFYLYRTHIFNNPVQN